MAVWRWRTLQWLASVMPLVAVVACGADDTVGGGTTGGSEPEPPPLSVPVVGPRAAVCAVGDRELDDGSCEPAGVAPDGCSAGFVSDTLGGCEPVLPSTRCAPGTVAFLGETSCHPVAPCGVAPWGTIPVDSTTQYVDDDADPQVANGSSTAPWATLADAVAAAQPGALIAIAAGSYGSVLIDKPVRLQGVCPELVEISGTSGKVVRLEADGSELRDVAVTAPSSIAIDVPASNVLIDRVWIHDASQSVSLSTAMGFRMTRSLIERASRGPMVYLSTALFEDVELRDGRDVGTLLFGFSFASSTVDVVTDVTLRRAIVRDQFGAGVSFNDSSVTIEDSYIDGVRADPNNPDPVVAGVLADYLGVSAAGTTLSVRGSVIANCDDLGVSLADSDARIESTTVRDVTSRTGRGASALAVDTRGKHEPVVVIERSVLRDSDLGGIQLGAGAMSLDSVLVRDVNNRDPYAAAAVLVMRSLYEPTFGVLTADGLVLDHNQSTALFVSGAEAVVRSLRVVDTRARNVTESARPIVVQASSASGMEPALLSLSHASVAGLHQVGIFVQDSNAVIDDAEIRTAPSANPTLQYGIAIQSRFQPAVAAISWSAIHDAVGAGIIVFDQSDASVAVAKTLVSGTRSLGDNLGEGIMVNGKAGRADNGSLRLLSSLARDNARAGLSCFGATVELSHSVFRCNAFALAAEDLPGAPFEVVDLGGNDCRCTAEDVAPCKIESAGPSVPDPLQGIVEPPAGGAM